MEVFRAVGDLSSYRNGTHGNLRSHQKGHMNVYYIEKRKKKISKTVFPRIKKKKTNKNKTQIRMPKKCHALYIYNRISCVCTHMYMEVCTRALLLWVVLHHRDSSFAGRKGFKAGGKLEKQELCSALVGPCGPRAETGGRGVKPENTGKI